MIVLLYVIISYLVMLGMLIESYEKSMSVPTYAWLIWLFSPVTFPIIIGLIIEESRNKS